MSESSATSEDSHVSNTTGNLFGFEWKTVILFITQQGRKERWAVFVFLTLVITFIFVISILIACKLDGYITQRWWVVLSPLWSLSLIGLLFSSCFLTIASDSMLKEDAYQKHYRKLRTGYSAFLLFMIVIQELLILLWLETILKTYVLVIFIPYYIWTVFYLTKLLILTIEGFSSPLIMLYLIDLIFFLVAIILGTLSYDFPTSVPMYYSCIFIIAFICIKIAREICNIVLFSIHSNVSLPSLSNDSKREINEEIMAVTTRAVFMMFCLLSAFITTILALVLPKGIASRYIIIVIPIILTCIVGFIVLLCCTIIAEITSQTSHASVNVFTTAKVMMETFTLPNIINE